MTAAEFAACPKECAWGGCRECFSGDMPPGWVWLLAYWARDPAMDSPEAKWLRDTALCPQHARALDAQLKDLGRAVMAPPDGEA
jgi:hypothetical protein